MAQAQTKAMGPPSVGGHVVFFISCLPGSLGTANWVVWEIGSPRPTTVSCRGRGCVRVHADQMEA